MLDVLLPLAVAAPLLAAALTPLLGRRLGRGVAAFDGLVLLGVALALARELPAVVAGEVITSSVTWLPDGLLTLSLRLDALALVFALVVTIIGVMVMAYSLSYFDRDDPAAVRIPALLSLFASAMLGVVLADDVILLFVAWELTSITSFFLIGGDGKGAKGATRALLVTAVGGLALLAGALLLTLAAGTGAVSGITSAAATVQASPLVTPAIVLLLLAAGTKSAQLPFHFWLPGAMVAPTPVSTYLHAATMVKAGIYLLLRMAPTFDGVLLWHASLVLVGGATAVLGAWVAFGQRDLKRLMAYSTVSQLGLLTALIGLGTPLALGIATLHVLAHALFKAALFMTVGVVDHATGTRDLDRLGGLRRALPLTATAGTLAALSMAGLPPLLGFVTKEEALAALLKGVAGSAWLGAAGLALIVLASIGTVAYSARYVTGAFLGPVRSEAHHVPVGFELPALLLAAAGLVLGPLSRGLTPLLDVLGRQLAGTSPGVKLGLWHGLTLPLWLSVAIVIVGGLVLRSRAMTERVAARLPRPSGERAFDRSYDATLALGSWLRRTATSHALAAYLLPAIGVLMLLVVRGLTDVRPTGTVPASTPFDWVVIVLLAGAILGVVQARSRIAAVAALGLAGFLVAGWFVLHGAPDLALTQLLVETLTVAVVIVVFRRLPDTFSRGGWPRRSGAAAIALLVGTGVGALTWLSVGRTGRSDLGSRFLEEAEPITGGANVVNTILVDFRALDTLGEISVLVVAALGIYTLVRLPAVRPLAPPSLPRMVGRRVEDPSFSGTGAIESVILRLMTDVLAPVLVVTALWLLLRGHDAVGGGFIGGLTAGAAVVLLYLSQGHERLWQSPWFRTMPLVGAGLVVAATYGLAGLPTSGSFLAGGKLILPGGVSIASSLVFDVGVFLVVVGLVVAVLRHLGQGIPEDEPVATRGGPAVDA
jgi:multicomponent Na+:H+ antiporter subunit A